MNCPPAVAASAAIKGFSYLLQTSSAAQCVAQAMLDHIRFIRPDARVAGFSVQPIIRRKHAHELFAGMATDPAFGLVLRVGAGRTGVEVLADRAIRLPPFERFVTEAMPDETRISRLLAGCRDVPATKRETIIDVLLALSDLASLVPDIAKLDINPLLADAEGVIGLDARVILRPPAVEATP